MSTKYFALLTKLGADRLANAAALGTKIEITHMAVGDGGGSLPTPDTNQQKLVNEKRRAAINVLSVDPKNTNQIIAEQVIPESEGGWWIREIGLFDKDGVLIAVGNCAETYKPQLQEGSGRTQTIRMVLIVSHTNAVTLKIDPSVVLATREYADASVAQAIRAHEQSRRHPDATLSEKGFVVLSNAIDSNSETQAATPKAVKVAYDLANTANSHANSRLEKRQNGADIPDKTAFINNLGLRDTISQAQNALPVSSAKHASIGYLTLSSGDNLPGMRFIASDAHTVGIEATHGKHLTIFSDAPGNQRRYTLELPEKNGTLATIGDLLGNIASVNTHVNQRLEKAKNGADIPNKSTFINNLGLGDTVSQAQNALPVSSAKHASIGYLTLSSGDNLPGMRFVSADAHTVGIEATYGKYLTIFADTPDKQRRYTLNLPEKNGTLATVGDLLSHIANITRNTANKSATGWWRCGDTGVILQWGRVMNASGEGRVVLPLHFPETTAFVQMTLSGSDVYGNATVMQLDLNQLSKESFSYALAGTQVRFNWFAVGY
ncbi:phage tail protein [Xenorhabdus sp. PB30.3]|uniref:phage tail protein n=1 Tax=Xenorhabdus sp. PB30.3 TaxID=2788941 RepID=UPI001E456CB4|nr:phage tail protein [Xenorhabdus sp. PB30.3]MCC8379570.1 phage tail protein [Xenorhabdus sp. PB30.3]